MSDARPGPGDDLGVFLAHAVALETEAMERHEELAWVMEVHNNPEAAAIFHKLAGYGAQHAAEVGALLARSGGPELAPWEFDWGGDDAPETSDMAGAHYLMTSAHALQMALRTERKARDWYASVAATASNAAVREYAQEFAEEEAEHVGYVEGWIARNPVELAPLVEDDDPAHMPE